MLSNIITINQLIELAHAVPPETLQMVIRKTHAYNLYLALRRGEIKTDVDGQNQFYQAESLPVRKKYFNALKIRLREKLYIALLVTKRSSDSEAQRRHARVHKNYSIIQNLVARSMWKNAIPLARKSFSQAINSNINEVSLPLASILQRYYTIIAPDKKKQQEYGNWVTILIEQSRAELLAQHHYLDVVSAVNATRSKKEQTAEMAFKYREELSQYLSSQQSIRFLLYYYNIHIYELDQQGALQELIKVGQQAIKHLESLPYPLPGAAYFSFKYKILIAALKINKPQMVNDYLADCLQYPPKGSHNWNVLMTYQVLFQLERKEYSAVYDTIQTVKKYQKQFSKILVERWKLYEAYLYLLYKIERFPTAKQFRFKKGKFFNEMPKFTKDKRGHNIALLIAQFLFFLIEKDYDQIIDRTEALNQYRHRYLRQGANYRSNVFLRILIELPKADFKKDTFQGRTRQLIKKLKAVNSSVDSREREVEIIPYEAVYEIIINKMI